MPRSLRQKAPLRRGFLFFVVIPAFAGMTDVVGCLFVACAIAVALLY